MIVDGKSSEQNFIIGNQTGYFIMQRKADDGSDRFANLMEEYIYSFHSYQLNDKRKHLKLNFQEQEKYMPETYKRINTKKWFSSDEQFNKLYPSSIQALSPKHWTPLSVVKKATKFLATENYVRILDIGSGVGKFCLSAAYYKPRAFYYGIEQRKHLIEYADAAKERLQIDNVSFITGNFTQLNFNKFDHFYFYNSFYENLTGTDKIDENIHYSVELYNYYNRYLLQQLDKKKPGTRLVTFHSLGDEIPKSFHEVGSEVDSQLKFWIKF